MLNSLEHQLADVPANPGVYLFKNSRGDILYVGKAKLLRSRVRSYFRGSNLQANPDLDLAKQQMVAKIATIETIVTDTENEALILEANLIRQHRPPYNVVLTDDKYYLFIKITTNEKVPRVFPVRRLKHDGARYFGPYSSARAVRHTLKLLRRIFPHRAEKDSPNDVVFPHPLFSLPTTNHQLNIAHIIRFLQGDRQNIIDRLRDGMQHAAQDKKYERAAIFRDQLQAIEHLEDHQKVFLPRPESFDVISVVTAASRSAANVLAIRKGKLLDKSTFLLKHQRHTNSADILRQFLLQYYKDAQDIPPTILIPEELSDSAAMAEWINKEYPPSIVTPHRGLRRQLIAMGQLNARQLLTLETTALEQEARAKNAMAELFQIIGILPASSAGDPPQWRVETYDISNIQGQHATGSMVVFTAGHADTDQYRKFRIATKDTPDDYHMLQEVLRRRFAGRHSDWKQPDLVLIDGGKGQLGAAHRILTELNMNIPVASIAKREEVLLFYERSTAGAVKIHGVRLPYDSDALYLIQRMRDEAHRFGLAYHQLLRSKQGQRSLLDEIPGIGPITKKRLLNHFGSLKNIRTATDTDLIKIIGSARTKSLRNFL